MTRPQDVLKPVRYDDTILYAVRALHEGVATEGQQKAFLAWLVRDLCRYHDLALRLGGDDGRRATDFMQGRQFVGAQVVKMMRPELTPKGEKGKRKAGAKTGRAAPSR